MVAKGGTQSRSARRAAGRTQVAVWLDERDMRRLQYLAENLALSRTDTIKKVLLESYNLVKSGGF